VPKTVRVPDEFLPLFERAEKVVSAYFELMRFDPERGHIDIDGERYMLIRAASMSVEFYDMMVELYAGREPEAFNVAKNLLFHIAHFIGRSDARAFHLKLGLKDPVEKLSAGPVHFAHTGWAFVDIFEESRVSPDESFFLVYDHPYSFESESWIRAGRKAPFPVCFMNAGYSSGWCEESFGLPLVASEIHCTGKGDPHCRFIMAHPSRIEAYIEEYLENHPDMRASVTDFEVPGEFESKTLEERLRVSEEGYRLLFENAFDAILVVDEGRIADVNRRAVELFGRVRGELRGRKCTSLAPDLQPDGRSSQEVFREKSDKAIAGEPQVFSWRCLGAGEEMIDTDVSLNRTGHAGHSLTAIMRDVTERRKGEAERERLENEVRQLQKMEALGTLAGGVAHDFNNLLTGIMGSIHLLREELPSENPVHRIAEDAVSAVDRASAMIRQLLTFARTSTAVPEPVDLNRIVEENLRLLRETVDRQLLFRSDLDPSIPPVMGDPNPLAQVVVNLALNARDALLERLECQTPYGAGDDPTIFFETALVRKKGAPTESDPAPKVRDFVRFDVTDNGIGMDEDTARRAFEPFFTTKPVGKGTGLGLTMVFGIVQRHGGWTQIESRPGMGTRVSVYFPAAPSGTTAMKRGGKEGVLFSHGHETVLFVDDDALLRRIAERCLAERGYSVLMASDGNQALGLYREEGVKIDVVVLDLTMPGLSGREVLARMRSIRPGVPVVLSSGYSTDDDAQDLLARGAADFLPKPYEPEDLARAIRAALGRN